MSRGPGSLQRRILVMLDTHPEHKLSRGQLRLLFPAVDRANLRRALRSLVSMGHIHERIEELELDPADDEWGPRWVFLARSKPLSPKKPDAQDHPAKQE